MFFEVFSFSGLQVEPRVRKRSDVRQKCFDEGMKFILGETERRIHDCCGGLRFGGVRVRGERERERGRETEGEGERGGEKRERERRGGGAPSLLLAFTFPTLPNCSQRGAAP